MRENVGYSRSTTRDRLSPSAFATRATPRPDSFRRSYSTVGGESAAASITYFDEFDPKRDRRRQPRLGPARRRRDRGRRDRAGSIAAPAGKPFFLWLHLYDAHDPYTPPEPYASRYPGQPYEAEIAYVDELVGQVRSAARASAALLDRTALIVTARPRRRPGRPRRAVPRLLRLRHDRPRSADAAASGRGARRYDRSDTARLARRPASDVPGAGRSPPGADGLDGSSLLPIATAAADPTRAVYCESLYPLAALRLGSPPRAARRPSASTSKRPIRSSTTSSPIPTSRERDPWRARRGRRTSTAAGASSGRVSKATPARRRSPADLDEETFAQLAALGYMAGAGGVALHEEEAVARADPKDRIALHQAIMNAQSALGAGEVEAARRHARTGSRRGPGHPRRPSDAGPHRRAGRALGRRRAPRSSAPSRSIPSTRRRSSGSPPPTASSDRGDGGAGRLRAPDSPWRRMTARRRSRRPSSWSRSGERRSGRRASRERRGRPRRAADRRQPAGRAPRRARVAPREARVPPSSAPSPRIPELAQPHFNLARRSPRRPAISPSRRRLYEQTLARSREPLPGALQSRATRGRARRSRPPARALGGGDRSQARLRARLLLSREAPDGHRAAISREAEAPRPTTGSTRDAGARCRDRSATSCSPTS